MEVVNEDESASENVATRYFTKCVRSRYFPVMFLGFCIAAAGAIGGAILYATRIEKAGTWSWPKQTSILEQKAKENQSKEEQKRQREVAYRERKRIAYDKFMDLANKNPKDVFTIPEQVDGWKRMDLLPQGYIYIESRGLPEFREPTLGDLERGIASYEREKAE
jgi:hypothetical protein